MTRDPHKGIPDSRAKTLSGIVPMLPGDRGKLTSIIGKYLKLECMTAGQYADHISFPSFLAVISK